MNLYWKKLFGGVMSTSNFETVYRKKFNDYKRYQAVASSKELAEYKQLFEQVKSSEFRENKRTLTTRKYKDTKWYRDMTKFRKLEKNADLQLYFRVLESSELASYLAFKEKPEYVQLSQPKLVKGSPELSRLKEFESSKEYKTYTRFHGSYILNEYLELKEKVSHEDFRKNNEFWENPNRWATTEEYKVEQKYLELSKNEDIIFYQRYKKSDLEKLSNLTAVFEENFDGNTMQAGRWQAGFGYKNDAMVKNHSYVNEQQANNGGDNTSVVNGVLRISTREQKTEALAWHPQKGFVMREFDYTSDVLNGRNAVLRKGGIFSAKVRFTGSKNVKHALWLAADQKTPRINICKFDDGQVEMGIYWSSKFETKYTSTRIKGLNFSDFLVYTLVWTEKELIWYVNNFEVFRTSDFVPTEEMFPVFNSFIPENVKGGEAGLEVDYVKVLEMQ